MTKTGFNKVLGRKDYTTYHYRLYKSGKTEILLVRDFTAERKSTIITDKNYD